MVDKAAYKGGGWGFLPGPEDVPASLQLVCLQSRGKLVSK
jgi:hypothetical protein